MYMLKSVGDMMPCGTPFLNWHCVDVVCDVFDNGVWDICLV